MREVIIRPKKTNQLAANCRRDPEVNKQNANFRNLMNGNELAIINKLLSVEEPALSCSSSDSRSEQRGASGRLCLGSLGVSERVQSVKKDRMKGRKK